MSKVMAVPGADLLIGRHQQTTASGEQEIPDHGEDLEENDEDCQG